MPDAAPSSVPGSCLCHTVLFTVQLPTLFCAHCHCSMCRRNHGAAVVTWFSVPPDALKITAGQDRLVRFQSSDHATRSFCGVCGSSLFFQTTTSPDRIDIVLANMDSPIDREPEFHVHFSDRIHWMPLDDELPRLGGPTGLEEIAE